MGTAAVLYFWLITFLLTLLSYFFVPKLKEWDFGLLMGFVIVVELAVLLAYRVVEKM